MKQTRTATVCVLSYSIRLYANTKTVEKESPKNLIYKVSRTCILPAKRTCICSNILNPHLSAKSCKAVTEETIRTSNIRNERLTSWLQIGPKIQ